jgi:type IV secretory pathway VirB2 component (pilin)
MSGSLADPSGSSSLVAAASWLQGALLGTVATIVAVIAVASVGLMMLSGRLDIRRGVTVLVGCFILLGAPAIAAGIKTFLAGGGAAAASYAEDAPPPPPPASPPPPPANPDPYAGASVPTR